MNNKVQQRFDRSIREALAVKPTSKPRKKRIDPAPFSEPVTVDRKGWKLRLDPQTGATVWGPE